MTIGALAATWGVSLVVLMAATWGAALSALLAAAALTLVGGIVGLLFSLPRAVAEETPAAGKSKALYALNINLEQVSDWLTKIIVGVGLVEARGIADYVMRGAKALGAAFNAAQPTLPVSVATVIGFSMIVAYPAIGFLIGFWSVRLYISRALQVSDAAVLRPPPIPTEAKQQLDQASRNATVPQRGNPENAQPVEVKPPPDRVLQSALNAPLDKLETVSDFIARAQALVAKARYDEAVQTFERALQVYGPEPALALEYMRAMLRHGPSADDWLRIIALLKGARARMGPETPLSLRRHIMQNLLNAYLYLEPPQGFQEAIRIGEEYAASPDGEADPFGYVYLAAAHGQAYAYWKAKKPESAPAEVDQVRTSIERALAKAEAPKLRNQILRWLQSLATSEPDDDLKEVVKDNESLRKLLELE